MSEDGSSEPQASPPSDPGGTSGPPLPPRIPDHELLRRIGRGAYGEVWLARSITGAYRAVKVVRRSSFDHDRPFQREFEGILKFEPISRTHESQVDILHVGRGEDYFYSVMELADDQVTGGQILPDNYHARTVKSDLVFRNRLPFEECVSVGIALATALEHLHRNGLVHRDVKPSNIIFVNGVAKLADIGLVTGLDTTRSYVGTEGFAAPEGPGTPQADLFSLGKVLYEMSTGKDRQQFPELPTNLREMPDREGLTELNAVIAKACRDDTRDRYQSAEEMRQDLLLMQSGKSIIRLRMVERRLAAAMRLGALSVVLVLLLGFGYLYQRRHSRIVTELAERTQRSEKQSREDLVRLQVANGTKLITQGSLASALSWFSKALANVTDDPQLEAVHRMRIGSILAIQPKLTHQFVHEGRVLRCGFTPDGRMLVTHSAAAGSDNGQIKVFDLVSGELRCSFRTSETESPHERTYSPALFFSSDGMRLIVRPFSFSTNAAAEIYDLKEGHPIGIRNARIAEPARILDSIDGRTALLARRGSQAQLVDLDSGEPRSELIEVMGEIIGGRLTRDRSHFALVFNEEEQSGPRGAFNLQIWNKDGKKPLGPPLKLERRARYLVSADGATVVMDPSSFGASLQPRLFDTRTAKAISAGRTFPGRPETFVIHADAQWLCFYEEITKHLWNFETGEFITLQTEDNIRHCSLSPDKMLIALANDGATVNLYNRSTGKKVLAELTHAKWCYGAAFSPEGRRVATSSEDSMARVWDLGSSPEPRLILRHSFPVESAVFSPDGKKIVTQSRSGPRIWEAQNGQPLTPPLSEAYSSGDITFSLDGRCFVARGPVKPEDTVFSNPGAWLWSIENPRSGPIGLATTNLVFSARFDPSSQKVVTVSQSGLGFTGNWIAQVWNAAAGQLLVDLLDPDVITCDAHFLSSNQIVTGCAGKGYGAVRLWNATSGKFIREVAHGSYPFYTLALSRNGRYLAAGAHDQSAYVWDIQNGELLAGPLWCGGTPVWVAFSEDSKRLVAFGATPEIPVWEVGQSEPALPLLGHSSNVRGAEFSRDGRFIGTCSRDGTARLWDAISGQLIVTHSHGQLATVSGFDPVNSHFMTAGSDGRVQLWTPHKCNFSLADITSLAEVLLSRRIQKNDSLLPFSVKELDSKFHELSSRLPEAFHTTSRQNALWHEQMALLAQESKNWPAVIWHLDHTLEPNPSLTNTPTGDELLSRRGNALAELGRFKEAAVDFEWAIRLDSDKMITWQLWFTALAAEGLTNNYAEICARAYRQFAWTTNANTFNEFGWRVRLAALAAYFPGTLADYRAPLKLTEEASSLDWRLTTVLALKGILLYRAARFEEALAISQAALPNGWVSEASPPVLFTMAMVYHRLGKPEEARAYYEHGHRRMEELHNSEKDRPDWRNRTINLSMMNEAKAVLAAAGQTDSSRHDRELISNKAP